MRIQIPITNKYSDMTLIEKLLLALRPAPDFRDKISKVKYWQPVKGQLFDHKYEALSFSPEQLTGNLKLYVPHALYPSLESYRLELVGSDWLISINGQVYTVDSITKDEMIWHDIFQNLLTFIRY